MKDLRVKKISAEVQRVLSNALYKDLRDHRIDPVKTAITEVEVMNDLSHAKVYISVIGDEKEKEETLKGFRKAEGFLKKEISQGVDLRLIPDLVFILDESSERGARIEELIREIQDED